LEKWYEYDTDLISYAMMEENEKQEKEEEI
jgi:hypothetical protein